MNNVFALILAAGKGKRMCSPLPKIFHKIGGLPIFSHIIHTLDDAKILSQAAVINPDFADYFSEYKNLDLYYQKEQHGTGHAVQMAAPYFADNDKDSILLVLFGDTPFIKINTIRDLVHNLHSNSDLSIQIAGFETNNANEYGRIFLNDNGHVERIIEYKDCNFEQKKQTLCNSGIMAFRIGFLKSYLSLLSPKNTQQEYYLTDLIEIARKHHTSVGLTYVDEQDVCGINNPTDLAYAENIFQNQKRKEFLEKGIQLLDPQTIYFSFDTKIQEGTIIEPFVVLGKNVEIGKNVIIKGFSHIEGASIKDEAQIGPFARLRPGTILEEKTKIGNFVEIKNASLRQGVKASHLSYIGDCEIGQNSNIGAGTIVCNYDGSHKHITTIGKDSFIGSNTSLVAPLHIGDNTIIAAGSVITRNVQDYSLSISRSKQVNKENWTKIMAERKKKNSPNL